MLRTLGEDAGAFDPCSMEGLPWARPTAHGRALLPRRDPAGPATDHKAPSWELEKSALSQGAAHACPQLQEPARVRAGSRLGVAPSEQGVGWDPAPSPPSAECPCPKHHQPAAPASPAPGQDRTDLVVSTGCAQGFVGDRLGAVVPALREVQEAGPEVEAPVAPPSGDTQHRGSR